MARNRKGPPDQAKHFQHDDHEHAAHQEEVPRGHAQKPGQDLKKGGKGQPPKTGHPMERTPKGPRKGQ
jgi:hypothetical protein